MEQEFRIQWLLTEADLDKGNSDTITKSFYFANCQWRFKMIFGGLKKRIYFHLLKNETDPHIIGIGYQIVIILNCRNDSYTGSKLCNTSTDVLILNLNTLWIDMFNVSILRVEYFQIKIAIKRFYIGRLNNSTSKTSISYDLEKLLEDSTYSDITLRTSEKVFKAHRNILAKRSIVFDRMLRCNMKEKVSNVIEMNVCPLILEEFLRYIYCDKVNNLEKYAKELLKLAHMYEVQSLGIVCYAELCINLTTENVVEILVLGNDYQTDNLKLPVIDFVIDHMDKIIDDANFDKITQNPQLTKKIFQRMSNRKQAL